MDIHEQDDLKDFLTSVFGRQVQGWPMNENTFNLTFELVAESSACSATMDLVPRPMPLGGQTANKMAKETGKRIVSSRIKRQKRTLCGLH